MLIYSVSQWNWRSQKKKNAASLERGIGKKSFSKVRRNLIERVSFSSSFLKGHCIPQLQQVAGENYRDKTKWFLNYRSRAGRFGEALQDIVPGCFRWVVQVWGCSGGQKAKSRARNRGRKTQEETVSESASWAGKRWVLGGKKNFSVHFPRLEQRGFGCKEGCSKTTPGFPGCWQRGHARSLCSALKTATMGRAVCPGSQNYY